MSDAGSTKVYIINLSITILTICVTLNLIVYQGVVASLALIIRKEGPAALFKGWLPAFIRLTPHTIVTFMVLEQFRNVYDHIILDVH